MREVFVGRHAELARLESAYAAAVDGRSQVVVLVGAAGVGKTALLRRFGSTLPLPVLAASGDEMEARLPFGVIGQVYAAAGQDAGDHLGPREPLTVGSALLDLVGPLQERGTVVIAIDDAHWSDQPSLQALAFALRRLRVDRALAILTLRSGEDHRLPASLQKVLTGDNATRIELDGLGIDEVRHLSIAIGAGAMSPRAATRIVDQTDGTPLYVKALLPHVTDLWSTSSRPIVAPPSFMQLTQAKLASCEPESRRLVEALAVVGTRAPLSSVVELAHLDDVTSSLDCAVAAGLVVEHTTPQMAVEFDHPLIRSAVYHGLRPAARSALHEGAAALAADPVDALRHRLAAALSPDVDLATSARSAATRLASEGSYERAAELLLEAARISRSSDERAAALLEAVELLVMGGSISEAAALRRQLLPLPASAHRSFVLARVAFVEGKGAESDRLLQDAWHLRHADDPGLVRKIAEQLGAICLVRGDAEDAVNWARRAIAASADPPDPQSGIVDTLSLALVIGGRVGEAMSATSHLDDMDLPNAADGLVGRGIAHLWRGDLSLAARTLRAASSRDRSGRPFLPWGLIGLTSLAEVEYLAGFWDDAITHSQLAVSIARDTEQDWIAAFAEAVAAWPLAGRGEHERARQHIDAGLQHIDESSVASGIIWLATAEALLGAARGDWASVLEAVAPLQRVDIADVVGQPGWGLWRLLMIEGLVHVGELEQADREASQLPADGQGERGLVGMSVTPPHRGGTPARAGPAGRRDSDVRGRDGGGGREPGRTPARGCPAATRLRRGAHGSRCGRCRHG